MQVRENKLLTNKNILSMKKLLLSTITMMLALVASAGDVTFQVNDAALWGLQAPSDGKGTYITSAENPNVSVTESGVTITTCKADASTSSCVWNTKDVFTFRSYKGSTMKISATENITKITFNGVSGKMLMTADGLTVDGAVATWSGSGTEVVVSFTGTSQLNSIVVTTGEAAKVQNVKFSLAAGTYGGAQSLTLSCPTPDATISYQIGGWDNPVAYNGETITVDKSMTVYAQAKKGEDVSEVTSASYTILDVNTVANINDIYNLNVDDVFVSSADMTVMFVQGNNTIITDGTRCLLVYGATGQKYNVGDVIPAGFGGTYKLYGGVGQLTSPTGFAEAKGTGTLPEYKAVETDAAILTDFKTDNMFLSPVQFKDVTITVSGKNFTVKDAKGEFLCYNQYGLNLSNVEADKVYTVKGFASAYNDKPEVMIAAIESAVVYVPTGDGTLSNAYTVLDVKNLCATPAAPETEVWVKGIIAGTVDTNKGTLVVPESAEVAVVSNLMLKDSEDNMISVQLPSGKVRTALNLKDNFDNLGKEVYVYGTIKDIYCQISGLKNPKDYSWDGVTTSIESVKDANNATVKVVKNGKLVILDGDKTFSVSGAQMK